MRQKLKTSMYFMEKKVQEHKVYLKEVRIKNHRLKNEKMSSSLSPMRIEIQSHSELIKNRTSNASPNPRLIPRHSRQGSSQRKKQKQHSKEMSDYDSLENDISISYNGSNNRLSHQKRTNNSSLGKPIISSQDYSNMNQDLRLKIEQAHDEKIELESKLKAQ